MILIIIWLICAFFIVKATAVSSKTDYTVNWDKMPKHKGIIKIQSIAMPDEMCETQREWDNHIKETLQTHLKNRN